MPNIGSLLAAYFVTDARGHRKILEKIVHHGLMIAQEQLVLFPLENRFLDSLKRLRGIEARRRRSGPSFAVETHGIYFVLIVWSLITTYSRSIYFLRVALLLQLPDRHFLVDLVTFIVRGEIAADFCIEVGALGVRGG